MFNLHQHVGVKIADKQSELYPMQRAFLSLASGHYGPDKSDIPNA